MLTPTITPHKKANGLGDAADEKAPLLGDYALAKKPTFARSYSEKAALAGVLPSAERPTSVGWLGRLFGASDIPMQQCARAECFRLCPTLEDGVAVPYCSIACTVFALGNEPDFAVCRNKNCVRRCYIDDDGNEHPFCSRSCARIAANPNGRKCARNDCDRKVYIDPSDPRKTYSYCSRDCFYLSCTGTEAKLTVLKSDDYDYKLIARDLVGAKIKKVIRVHMPEDQMKAYLNKRALEGDTHGRQTRRVYAHAETRCSGLRASGGKKLCKKNCSTCDVLRRGYIQYGTKAFERYPTNSMMHGVDECCTRRWFCFGGAPLRSMIVADVCAVTNNNAVTVNGPCSLAAKGILPRFVVLFK